MKVIRAEEMGMCFGVRDALQMTTSVHDPTQVTIHGQLVHNAEILTRLAARGFRQSSEEDRIGLPETPVVLITAHGLSDAERRRLEAANKELIDSTCPLVRRVHEAAMELQTDGRHVLVIGKRGHVEVRGIVEDLQSYDVIGTAEEVQHYEHQRLGIVCQTTVAPDIADAVTMRVRHLNPLADVRFVETICQPTRLRQRAMLELLTRVEAVVVVGGCNSNNTRQLVRLCQENRTPVWHVERVADLDPAWFTDVATVGLTAGTSTLDSTVDEVHAALEGIDRPRTKGTLHADNVDAASHAIRPAT